MNVNGIQEFFYEYLMKWMAYYIRTSQSNSNVWYECHSRMNQLFSLLNENEIWVCGGTRYQLNQIYLNGWELWNELCWIYIEMWWFRQFCLLKIGR